MYEGRFLCCFSDLLDPVALSVPEDRLGALPRLDLEHVPVSAVTGCGKLYRARSRLYRNEILQVNMRWKALAEIYTMHSFALLFA